LSGSFVANMDTVERGVANDPRPDAGLGRIDDAEAGWHEKDRNTSDGDKATEEVGQMGKTQWLLSTQSTFANTRS